MAKAKGNKARVSFSRWNFVLLSFLLFQTTSLACGYLHPALSFGRHPEGFWRKGSRSTAAENERPRCLELPPVSEKSVFFLFPRTCFIVCYLLLYFCYLYIYLYIYIYDLYIYLYLWMSLVIHICSRAAEEDFSIWTVQISYYFFSSMLLVKM